MTTRQLRFLRAAAATSVATFLAAVSHTVAGGAAPHPLLIVAVAALLMPPAALLVGIRPSLTRLTATVLLSQAVFHSVFQALGAPTADAAVLGHAHHLDLASLAPVAAVTAPDALMLVAHVVAAVLTTALLWRGESVVRRIVRWVHARLRLAVTTTPTIHRLPARPVADTPFAVSDASMLPLSRRGPPLNA
ncbi:hypothetical protein [Microbacterium hydrocarbonoxydans]|uniref:hypothetical protein n=1 Tax=Microbacterium hydrocarbonoxydans TaxID=273678 RepID=UPI00203B6D63|nr:hypothetical protein [Microbacterium hydrocarbonoxydans]MCM3779174.1 hypothetical protein [Microbacterium hydrocarbonoxydans]